MKKRRMLSPLASLYSVIVRRKNAAYDNGSKQPQRLHFPVISVGSLSAGGAGKTPAITALADLLQRNGYSVDVLSRGYGRSTKNTLHVDPEGKAKHFGDEPLMLARRGLNVYVGTTRFAAGQLAEQSIPANARHIHLLDDGFQHRALARDVDIVLLTLEDTHDKLLPAGNLREPLTSLARAHAILVRDNETESLSTFAQTAPTFALHRALHLGHTPPRPFAFCAIARPSGFFDSLCQSGVEAVQLKSFRDHHRYHKEDVERLIAAARRAKAGGFITTEKDAVKLKRKWIAKMEEAIGPVLVARLDVRFQNEPALLDLIRSKVAAR